MAYQGSAAYRLDTAQQTWEVPARRLSVHEGGRTEVRTRADAMAGTFALVRLVIALTVAIVALGAIRVALTAQTVTLLKQVSVAETTVASERTTRSQLQMERSTLSSADRIQRIATENYGMVYASDVDTIHVTMPEDAVDQVAEDAQFAEEGAADAPQV